MSQHSPELSSWEDLDAISDDEQLFSLVEKSPGIDYNTDKVWTLVYPRTNDSALQIPAAQTPVPCLSLKKQTCDHLAEKGCSLDKSGQCCACSDKRPMAQSGIYSMYKDGRGWVATRWAYYCPGCKNHQETHILNQVMERLQKIAAQREAERRLIASSKCEHWLPRKCAMTNTGKCCACSDLRTGAEAQRYRAYADGRGWVADVSKWEHYCPGCKGYHASQHDLDDPIKTSTIPGNPDSSVSTKSKTLQSLPSVESSSIRQCSHFTRRGCSLTATNGDCCACADDRPRSASGLYKTYIDGRGWTEGATRWAGYCPNCQKAFDHYFGIMCRSSFKKRKHRLTQPAAQVTVEIPLSQSLKKCDQCKATACSLSTKLCCSCSDKRPNAPSYPKYVDGAGWMMGAERWDYYCPGCRESHEIKALQPRRQHIQTPAKGITEFRSALRPRKKQLRHKVRKIMC